MIKIIIKFSPLLSQSNGNPNKKGLNMKTRIFNGGGGYRNTLQNHPVISGKSISLFKPIIASSLAAMLGVSVASAAATCDATSTGSIPSLCFNSAATNLNDLEFPVSGNIFTPTHKENSQGAPSTTIEQLVFKFDSGTSATPSGQWDIDKKAYTISKTRGEGTFTLDGRGKGMVMGANSTGTLFVDFDPDGQANKRVFELKLGSMQADALALKGNIAILAGEVGSAQKSSKFEACLLYTSDAADDCWSV